MRKQTPHYPVVALAIAGLLVVGAVPARAQSQGDSAPSLAEAARRAREQKKHAGKPARTLTNEDLPPLPQAGSSQASGESAQASGNLAAEPAKNEPGARPTAPAGHEQDQQEKAENAAALEHAKKELAQAQSELDVMERKALLDSDSYYSKPDFASDKEGKANLDTEARQISDKKQSVEALKARVAELQALAGEAGSAEPDNQPPSR